MTKAEKLILENQAELAEVLAKLAIYLLNENGLPVAIKCNQISAKTERMLEEEEKVALDVVGLEHDIAKQRHEN